MNEIPLSETIFKGIPVSPGTAIGVALTIGSTCPPVDERSIDAFEVDNEIEIFRFRFYLIERIPFLIRKIL